MEVEQTSHLEMIKETMNEWKEVTLLTFVDGHWRNWQRKIAGFGFDSSEERVGVGASHQGSGAHPLSSPSLSTKLQFVKAKNYRTESQNNRTKDNSQTGPVSGSNWVSHYVFWFEKCWIKLMLQVKFEF